MKPFKNHVQQLRHNTTDAENHLWYFLRAKRFKGYKFRRQHMIYPFVVDFVCIQKKLIIELDGSQHVDQITYDEKRTAFLQGKGYHVLRFWNDAIFLETEAVLETIFYALEL